MRRRDDSRQSDAFAAVIAARITFGMAIALVLAYSLPSANQSPSQLLGYWIGTLFAGFLAFSRAISERTRAYLVTGNWIATGLFAMFAQGFVGGPVALMVAVGLAGALIDRRAGLVALLVSALGFAVAAWLYVEERVPLPAESIVGLRRIEPWLLQIGVFVVVGIMLVLAQSAASRELARETQLRRRLAIALERSQSSIVMTGPDRKIEWVNEAFTRVTGYSLEDSVGKIPGAFLQGPATDKAVVARMRAQLKEGSGFSCDLVNYTKSGTPYWTTLEVRPLAGDEGSVVGFTAIQVVCTESKVREVLDAVELGFVSALGEAHAPSDCLAALLAAASRMPGTLAAQSWSLAATSRKLRHFDAALPEPSEMLESFVASSKGLELTSRKDGDVPTVEAGRAVDSLVPPEQRADAEGREGRLDPSRHRVTSSMVLGERSVLGVIELVQDRAVPGNELVEARLTSFCELTSAALQRVVEQRRFESLFEGSPDALFLVDRDGVIVQANARAEDLFDRATPLVGLAIRVLLGDVRDALAAALDASAGAEQPALVERTVRAPAGGELHVEASFARVEGLEAERVVIAVRDVTAARGAAADLMRERASRELVEAQRGTLVRMLGALPVGLVLVDPEGRVEQANRALCALLERSESDLVGKPAEAVLGCSLDEVLLASSGPVSRKTSELRLSRDVSLLRASGESVPVELSNVRLDLAGREHRLIAFVDLSDRKRAERDIVQARDLAEAAARTKGEFLANTSHELRTPLNAIVGMAGLLVESQLDAQQRGWLTRIDDAAKLLLGLIDDLLDQAKIESGKLVLDKASFSLPAVLQETLAMVRPRATEKGLDVRLSYPSELPRQVVGDARRVAQVLLNLLSNAVKFTERGSVQIRVELLHADRRRSTVCLVVEDTGIGMNAEVLARVFTPFVQADGSVTRRFGGTGLGLSISKSLAVAMGGGLEATSVVGKGSAFRFTLPLEHAGRDSIPDFSVKTSRKGPEAEPIRRDFAGGTVLVAEDNEVNRELVTTRLERLGIRVVCAVDGKQALEQVETAPKNERGRPFDVVLMDVQMPVMDGFEATGRIRALSDPDRASIPIIAVTAHASPADRQASLDAGMNEHIAKPIDFRQLPSVLAPFVPNVVVTRDRSKFSEFPATSEPVASTQQGLEVAAALARLDNDVALYRKVLTLFVQRFELLPAELARLLGAGERNVARRMVHDLKGSSGMVGLPRVAEAAARTETEIVRGAGADELDSLSAELRRGIELVRRELASEAGEGDRESSPPSSYDIVREGTHLLVTQAGRLRDVEELRAFRSAIEAAQATQGLRRIVFDNRESVAPPDVIREAMWAFVSDAQRFDRVALVLRSEARIVRASNTAAELQSRVETFSSIEDARAWIEAVGS